MRKGGMELPAPGKSSELEAAGVALIF